ncbi:MAG: hypothetical protein J6P67_03575 [Bacteroidaceae bacterium]|nr:hypothetical protein [Bacteroidaceae bacterium]
MTKKQYNDDALYQEIMASLEPGAAEYDRMMASGEAPAKRKRVSSLVWYAAAAAVVGLLVVTATLFVGNEDGGQHIANTVPASEGKHLVEKAASVPHMENADSDLHRLTAKIETVQEQQSLYPTPQKSIYTAMLPEVDFCPKDSDDAVRSNAVSSSNVRLPQVRKERSFTLVCNVVLPDITAYADSTIFTSSTELMVACDEICYNDSNF